MNRRGTSRAKSLLAGALLAAAGASALPARAADGDRVLTLVRRVVDLSRGKQIASTTITGNKVAINLSADVLFPFARATLTARAQQTLRHTAVKISAAKDGTVLVDGYTDTKGSDGVNLPLSAQRAQAVADALKQLTGPALTFRVAGHGAADAVASNSAPDGSDNPAGRALNRRVSITFQR